MSLSANCILCCINITQWFPVLFLISMLSWSYYAYVVLMLFFYVDDWVKRSFYLVFYHLFASLFLWSYYQVVFTNAGNPSSEFYLSEVEKYELNTARDERSRKEVLDRKAKDLPLLQRSKDMSIRICEKCHCIKPDRAHHCSSCGKCILKMDHHCPWVNNCVGFANYKHFILFLFYGVTYCIYVASTSLEYFIQSWNDLQAFTPGRFHLIFLFFVSLMFSVSICSLLAYHIYLVLENTTTFESCHAPYFYSTGLADRNGFNLSKKENFKQVFGNSLFKAFLPISSRDETSFLNGYDFTRLVRFASLVKLNETQSNLSKITIIGNGWGNSKTILSSFDIKLIHPQHVVESRQNDTDLLKKTNKIMIKYNQFDEDDNDSSISIDENYAVNDHLKLSSSSATN